jgi:hypothetical protein
MLAPAAVLSATFANVNLQLPQPKPCGGTCLIKCVPQRKNQFFDFQGLRFSEELFSKHTPAPKNPSTTNDSPSKTRGGGKF